MPGTSTVIPSPDTEFLNWMNHHSTVWGSNFADIGLTQAVYNTFKIEVDAANTAWDAWTNAKTQYKAASEAWRAAKKQARTVASNDVKTIRTFAARQEKPATVYTLADIPGPKTPNFGIPPGTPTGANVTLDVNSGNLEVRFECNNPAGLSGTVYLVQRRTAMAANPTVFGPFTQAAVTSTKRFIDSTITAGTASVQYIITAQRGTIVGTSSLPITVQFGRAGNGPGVGAGFVVTEGEFAPAKSPKLAA